MAERFDSLFAGISEESALQQIKSPASHLDNPVSKYMAATRLGACHSEESLQALIACLSLTIDDLYERITRRKAIEALGRRRDPRALPHLLNCLVGEDEIAIIDAVDAIIKINGELTPQQSNSLAAALDGSDNRKRVIIQAHTRLGLNNAIDEIRALIKHDNPLVSGAARSYFAKRHGETNLLPQLVEQLCSDAPGQRRAAVIDLGDSGDRKQVNNLIQCPVSMPLRAKSVLELIPELENDEENPEERKLFRQLLIDNPNDLALKEEHVCPDSAEAIENFLQHRDEAKQYGAAKRLLKTPQNSASQIIENLHQKLGSDYVIHYYLTMCAGLMALTEHKELIISSLHETIPQYTKSRVAATWGCLQLGLMAETDFLAELNKNARWVPLKWACRRVLEELS